MGANKLTMDCNKNRNNNANEVAEDATVSSQVQTQTTTFPQKLMQILSEENHEGQLVYEDIMHWTPDGKAFVIENRAKVSTIILPRHFGGEAEFRSFTRRLLRWGFKRILQKGKGSSSATFQHEMFQRDNPTMCLKIKTSDKIKVTQGLRRKRDPEPEENDNAAAFQFKKLKNPASGHFTYHKSKTPQEGSEEENTIKVKSMGYRTSSESENALLKYVNARQERGNHVRELFSREKLQYCTAKSSSLTQGILPYSAFHGLNYGSLGGSDIRSIIPGKMQTSLASPRAFSSQMAHDYAENVIRAKEALYQSILEKQLLRQEVELLAASNCQIAVQGAALAIRDDAQTCARPGSTLFERNSLLRLKPKNISASEIMRHAYPLLPQYLHEPNQFKQYFVPAVAEIRHENNAAKITREPTNKFGVIVPVKNNRKRPPAA